MDQFEKKIFELKEDMDQLDPSNNLWDRIEDELDRPEPKVRTIFWGQAMRIAAAVSAILMIFWLGYLAGNQDNTPAQVTSTLPEEFLEVEKFYQSKIEVSKAAVFSTPLDEDLNYQFKKDLVTLDSIYVGLKKLYAEKGAQPRLLEHMILNLQKQSELLQIQLEVIQKQKARGHEKENISA